MASKIRLIITTGDADGIGWEVTCKALNAIGPKAGVQFIFYRGAGSSRHALNKRKFRLQVVGCAKEASLCSFDSKTAIEIRSSLSPAHWVEEAAQLCMQGVFQGLVTAPLSKTSILASGFKDIGHTEILARVSGHQKLFMGFLGHRFNVLLATGHLRLREALDNLNLNTFSSAIETALELRASLSSGLRHKPIALLGVNPHAGEQGILGPEEGIFQDWIESKGWKKVVKGPLVPDSAFLEQNWRLYSVYVCPYHDQGLIPFKMVHGFGGGVHLTLGLPFVRTSVDHGTAKELFGKDKAQFGSMMDALLTAVRLIKKRMR